MNAFTGFEFLEPVICENAMSAHDDNFFCPTIFDEMFCCGNIPRWMIDNVV
jgi:hypothetical protein